MDLQIKLKLCYLFFKRKLKLFIYSTEYCNCIVNFIINSGTMQGFAEHLMISCQRCRHVVIFISKVVKFL